jgi:hypothetical protein
MTTATIRDAASIFKQVSRAQRRWVSGAPFINVNLAAFCGG